MAKGKSKTVFFCKDCGFESVKWLGQCPGCHEWNTFVEEPVVKSAAGRERTAIRRKEPSRLSEVSITEEERTLPGFGSLDDCDWFAGACRRGSGHWEIHAASADVPEIVCNGQECALCVW